MMMGAVLGDIIGSSYEFDPIKTKDFELFVKEGNPEGRQASTFTDDTVMTCAIARALTQLSEAEGLEKPRKIMSYTDAEIKEKLVETMVRVGRYYPNCGFGGMFYRWINGEDHSPYNSLGNGSSMRVSPVAWAAVQEGMDLGETTHLARLTAEVSHNHPDGIRYAEATAGAMWLALHAATKAEIGRFWRDCYGVPIDRRLSEIRPRYRHMETSEETVPVAFRCFLEGNDYEDVIRNVVSMGGDADTEGAIAGGIAECFYGVPNWMVREGEKRLPEDLHYCIASFSRWFID